MRSKGLNKAQEQEFQNLYSKYNASKSAKTAPKTTAATATAPTNQIPAGYDKINGKLVKNEAPKYVQEAAMANNVTRQAGE